MPKLNQQPTKEFFKFKLANFKNLIDNDIKGYSNIIRKSTFNKYGANSRLATDAYLEILSRGGKRIRGALTMIGFEMMGGKNKKMIKEAARAIEMIHAYILIMDDIQDNSSIRRGGPTAHKILEEYHQKNYLAGNSEHFGVSLALNAMGFGNHAAQVLIANLNAPEDLRNKATSILNQSIMITCHGQTNDIMNEVSNNTTMQDVNNVLEWKTAHYTFLNPLTFGMVLAGANCSATDAVREYSLNAGRAFQITDDILGVFASEQESGKSPMDDIKEGKRTALTMHALENAENADKNFLIQMLGNKSITQTEFERCKDIIIETGALSYAQKEAKESVEKAIESIKNRNDIFSSDGIDFLIGLALSLIDRKS
jgi:geranylgeranyl pyrophosphate synthase